MATGKYKLRILPGSRGLAFRSGDFRISLAGGRPVRLQRNLLLADGFSFRFSQVFYGYSNCDPLRCGHRHEREAKHSGDVRYDLYEPAPRGASAMFDRLAHDLQQRG